MKSPRQQIDVHSTEFRTEVPDIFADIPWVRYGETRRTNPEDDALSGSVAQADLPLDATFDLQEPPGDRAVFKSVERIRSANRIAALLGKLGLHELARPRPEYATGLITDEQFDHICSTREDRAFADAVHTRLNGRGIMFSPADCPLVVVADPTKYHESLTVIHAGYKSLGEDIVGLTLGQLPLTTKNAHVFITPHALNNYPVYGAPLKNLENSPVTRDHLGPTDDKGNRNLNFSSAIIARLGDFGIRHSHIAVSPDDSLTDPTLFSQRNWQQKGVNGRNAIMAGIVRH